MGYSHFNAATLLIVILPLVSCYDSIILSFMSCDKSFDSNFPNQTSNVKDVISELVRTTELSRFAMLVKGTAGADDVYGLAWCRADMDAAICRVCVSEAAKNLQKSCPNSVAARIWHGNLCSLRHGGNFFGKPEISLVRVNLHGSGMIPEEYRNPFTEKMTALMDSLRQKTPLTPMKFAKEDAVLIVKENVVINVMALCSRDLYPEGCKQCLSAVVKQYRNECKNRYICELIFGSCVVRYDAKTRT